MKSLKTVFLLSASIFILCACDELITKDVDVPITFEVFQEIDIKADPNPYQMVTFEYDGFYDILSHPDVANAIGTPDKIKKVQITKIKYEYRNFKGNVDAVIRGDVIMPEESFTHNIPFDRMFAMKSVKVAESALFSEQYTLDGNFNKVNEYLSQSAVFEYAFSGVTTHNPVNVITVFKVYATITVEASLDYKGNFK